jgi:hypothetical protein
MAGSSLKNASAVIATQVKELRVAGHGSPLKLYRFQKSE